MESFLTTKGRNTAPRKGEGNPHNRERKLLRREELP